MTIVSIIYILFVVINIIICSILIYIEYNNGEKITLGDICTILGIIVFSLLGTIWVIISILEEYSDIVILKKKRKNKLK